MPGVLPGKGTPPPSGPMTSAPPRGLGLLLGGLFLALLVGAIGLSVSQLAAASVSAWIILWVALPLVSVPLAVLVAYRLYGLLSGRYHLDRDGFLLSWGLAVEQIPLTAMAKPRLARQIEGRLLPARSLWWPGCVVGRSELEGLGTVEFFASSGPEDLVLVSAGDRHLAISPPDPEAFLQAFTDAVRLGSLEQIPALSQRPDFLFNRIWNDRWARPLLVSGLALLLFLLAYLAVRVPGLSLGAPFGFDPAGMPGPLAPPGRLLLLPLIGGLCWLADLGLGAWLYRREGDQILAYALWGAPILVGALLWGAALQLIAAAPLGPVP